MRTLLCLAMALGAISIDAQSYLFQNKISEPFREALAAKGTSVALEGDYAFVGVPDASKDTNGVAWAGLEAGRVDVYQKDSSGYYQYAQSLQGVPRFNMADFGMSLAVEDSTLIVGAPGDDIGGIRNGAVHVFKLRNNRWTFDTRFSSPDTSHDASFGVSLGMDGTTLVVGAIGNKTDSLYSDSLDYAGAAYVYEYLNGSWVLQDKLSASAHQAYAYFGMAVAVKGSRIAVSTTQESGTYGSNAISYTGADYIFDLDSQGNWNESMHIRDSLFDGGAFGYQWIGNNLLRSSPSYFHGYVPSTPWFTISGRLFYLDFGPSNSWSVKQRIDKPNSISRDIFSQSFHFDGQRLAVASPRDDRSPTSSTIVTEAGSVAIFDYDANSDSFNFSELVVAGDRANPQSAYDNFGNVALAGDHLLVGVPGDDHDSSNQNPLNNAGSIYFYELGCSLQSVVRNDTLCAGDGLWYRGQYYAQAGTYLDTVSPALGCDTAYTLHLAFRPALRDTIAVQACDSTITLGGQTVYQSGWYTDTLSSIFGCDSTVVQAISIQGVDTTVLRSPNGLQATAQNATFQWIDCLSNQPLVGETDSVLTVPSGRSSDQYYAVIISQNGCVDTSYCFLFESDLGHQSVAAQSLKVYPNPAGDFLQIELAPGLNPEALRLLDLNGRVVLAQEGASLMRMDLRSVPQGLYVLEVEVEGYCMREKVLVE